MERYEEKKETKWDSENQWEYIVMRTYVYMGTSRLGDTSYLNLRFRKQKSLKRYVLVRYVPMVEIKNKQLLWSVALSMRYHRAFHLVRYLGILCGTSTYPVVHLMRTL